MRHLEIEENEIDPYLIYDLIINGAGLICSHCGKRVNADELIEQKIVLGNEEGYLSHVDCLLSYIMKSEPSISSGLASGLFSEAEIRHDLLSRPYESVILDVNRACSFKHLTPSFTECSKFIASESNQIEERINYNLEIIIAYLEESLPQAQSLDYSDLN